MNSQFRWKVDRILLAQFGLEMETYPSLLVLIDIEIKLFRGYICPEGSGWELRQRVGNAEEGRGGQMSGGKGRAFFCVSIRKHMASTFRKIIDVLNLIFQGQLFIISPIRQICFADFAYSHHSCLPLCMYPCVTFCINVCFHVVKSLKKITYMDSNISSRIAHIPFFYSLTLTIYKVNIFAFFLFFDYLVNAERVFKSY